MASNVGQGPPAGENNEPSTLRGAVPGQPQDEGGFRSNLETMRESINVVGKLNVAMSGFSSKLRGDGKRKLDEFTAGIRTLNKELEETVRLLEESGQGSESDYGIQPQTGKQWDRASGTYTQRQLPKSPDVDTVVSGAGGGAERGDGGRGQGGDGDGRGGGGFRSVLGNVAAGAVAFTPFAMANWFERQRDPARMADMQFTRLAMGSAQTPQDLNAAMRGSFAQNQYTGHQEFFGTQAALEQRGVVAGGQDFNRFMREAGAMRSFIPHQSTEAIAGAAATLAHGQAGHSLRMRGIIDRNASTEKQFRQILTAASAHDRLPTGAELRAANPGTAMYAVLMNFTGGDAELVRMIIDWGIAEDASKRRTGEEISLTAEHAAAMGMDDTIEFSERERAASASGRVADRQEDLADTIQTQNELARNLSERLHQFSTVIPGTESAFTSAAGALNSVTQAASGLLGTASNLAAAAIAGRVASGKGLGVGALIGKTGSVLAGGAIGGKATAAAAGAGAGVAGIGVGSVLGGMASALGLTFGASSAQRHARKSDNRAIQLWGEMLNLIPGVTGFTAARDYHAFRRGDYEDVSSLDLDDFVEPAGGPPHGWVEGADHDGPGYSEKGFGGVKPHVARTGHFIDEMFGPFPGGIGGVGSRQGKSDHPRGLALDFMTNKNTKLGDRVVNFLSRNAKHFAVKYIIWKQRINSGDGRGWRRMEDRGSITANHFDHPHVSFKDSPSTGTGGFEPFIESDDTGGAEVDRSVSDDTGLTADVNVSSSGYYSREESDIWESFGGMTSTGGRGVGGSTSEDSGAEGDTGSRPDIAGTGTLSDTELASLARYGGWRGADLVTAVAVALAESGGDPSVNAPGREDSRGLWQINSVHFGRFDKDRLYDPHYNAEAAYKIWRGRPSWADWSVHPASSNFTPHNSYDQYLDRARDAVSQVSASVEPAGGMPMSEGQPSGGMSSMSVGAAMPSLSAGQTRQVNVSMNIRIERASRAEAERLAEMVKGLVEEEAGIHMVGSR